MQTACPHCSRANPGDALFCYHDGGPLGALPDPLRLRFAAPFIFPSGRSCWTFDELALACHDDWPGAVELLNSGALAAFLGGLGRHDLASAASEAVRLFAGVPTGADRALDRFLRELPARSLQPARLAVAPVEIDFGRLRVGQDQDREVRLENQGMGLLHGAISSDVPWLVVGEGGSRNKLFSEQREVVVCVQVRGRALRACLKPQQGHLIIESSGGRATVAVNIEVPPQTFAAGVLAGARTPRQLAEKARLAPKEAARLFETGAVARWYRDNGWTYPVEGSPAAGLAAVQQFFDALGVSAPPKLELSDPVLSFEGTAGESLLHTVRLGTVEKRPVYATASSDQPWLVVSGVDLDGSNAHIHVSIPTIPDRPGRTLQAMLSITGNSRQRFAVPVSLRIAPDPNNVFEFLAPAAGAEATGPAAIDWLPFTADPGVVADRGRSPCSARGTRNPEDSAPATPTPGAVADLLPPLPPQQGMSRAAWMIVGVLGLVFFLGLAGIIAGSLRSRQPEPVTEDEASPVGETPALKKKDCPPQKGKQPPARPRESPPDQGTQQPDRDPKVTVPIEDVVRPRTKPEPPPLAVPELVAHDVEVVFCIDTTGSMGGLLSVAKQTIWAICNQIASGKPVPQLRVGLVAYRDRGDDYITKITPLTSDIDEVHLRLHGLVAAGGGDEPESVNQALAEAVNDIRWSTDKKTLRIIFLVGDAPPHMDYPDDVKYPRTCKKAVKKGIIINTIQCGNSPTCRRYWKDIASRTEGAYVAIPLNGGIVANRTMYDEALALVGVNLLATALVYGDDKQKRRGERMLAAARALRGPSAADRAAFAAKSKQIGPYDLLDAIKSKRIKLADVPEEQLPAALRRLKTVEEREKFLDRVAEKREELQEEAVALEKKRALALLDKGKGRASFDTKVLEILRKQAKKYDIDY